MTIGVVLLGVAVVALDGVVFAVVLAGVVFAVEVSAFVVAGAGFANNDGAIKRLHRKNKDVFFISSRVF